MTTNQLNLNYLIDKLTEYKASDIVTIDVSAKTDIANHMVIATATSKRHAVAMANKLCTELKHQELGNFKPQGIENGNWVVIDTGSIIIHIFLSEVRANYNLEQLWQQRPVN